ncbi:hypothetical protein CNR22_05945 [Sphingobacteriaceae bacterium]|nr:hypothetical protein CNR22_05945 [Sphingobacteriaceae bacterium]
MKKTVGSLCLFFLAQITFGQGNSNLLPYAENVSYTTENKLTFAQIDAKRSIGENGLEAFLNTTLFGNGINKVSIQKTEKDGIGYTNIKFAILQNGIPLANKVIIAHCKNGKLVSLNGDLSDVDATGNSFVINESQALSYALAKVNAEKYKWENVAEERHMREALNDPSFSYKPVAQKMILEKDGKLFNTYCFNIYAEVPLYRANVFVDASTGKVLDEQNLICTADVPGTAVTKYSGNQNMTVDNTGTLYRLRETQRGLGIETYNLKNTVSYSSASDFTNTTSNWTSTGVDQGATDAHWGAEMTYDYYLNEHNRNSINNAGFKLLSYVHYTVGYTNAFWDGNRMTYGDGGSGYTIFTGLDVCGHEITHGLTSNSGNLTYSNESGALNEAFSDIFGQSIENYARPNQWSWKIGEDITNGGLRDMSNPSSFFNPDTYGGTYYYTGTADNGGVHTNSGVANYWFYLLTSGGSGTNDISNAYSVSGIGFTDAAAIAFRALTVYFTPSTNYANARLLTIQAARDLYGDCSNQVIQTTKAWYAVGVGTNYVNGLVPNFYSNVTSFCSAPATVTFSNTTANGLSYTWDFGDGSSASTSTNAAHTYTAVGSYSIKLKVIGCANLLDSITKTTYVVVNPPIPAPVTADANGCENGSAVLTATGNATVKWYENPTGGAPLGSGSIFSTPAITTNVTYYAANTVTLANVVGGKLSPTGGGIGGGTSNYLIFDVLQNGVLNSVIMSAQTNGARVIQIRNSANQVVFTTTVTLAIGANTVVLNCPLTVGANYRIGLATGSATNLYRSTSGLNYPYNIGGCVNITTSNTGNSAYYFFYGWNISKEECASPRVPVQVSIVSAPVVTLLNPSAPVCAGDQIDLQGSPAGGIYTGSGMNGNVFSASALGAGTYSVSYVYTDAGSTCSNVAETSLIVEECTGIAKTNPASSVSIYPNPAKDNLVVNSGIANASVAIADATGRLVLIKTLNSSEEKIKLDTISNGMYIISVLDGSGKTIKTMKLIKE